MIPKNTQIRRKPQGWAKLEDDVWYNPLTEEKVTIAFDDVHDQPAFFVQATSRYGKPLHAPIGDPYEFFETRDDARTAAMEYMAENRTEADSYRQIETIAFRGEFQATDEEIQRLTEIEDVQSMDEFTHALERFGVKYRNLIKV